MRQRQERAAALLAGLVGSETEPHQPGPRRRPIPHGRRRMWVGLALIAALLAGLLFPQALPLPQPEEPQALRSLVHLVEQLPQDAPVLIALEFEPAQLAEMRASFQPILAHLLRKNASLVWVSSRPGAVLYRADLLNTARRSLGLPAQDTPPASYLAGGTLSVRSLLRDPVSWNALISEGNRAGVISRSELRLTIVLAGDAEAGREWIEQSAPQQHPTLVVVSAAQAAPLLQPYYDAGQVAGLSSGLSGAQLYARRTGFTSASASLWKSVQTSSLVAFLLILSGVITALRLPRARRRRPAPARSA